MAGPSASYNGFDDTDENTRLYFFIVFQEFLKS